MPDYGGSGDGNVGNGILYYLQEIFTENSDPYDSKY